MDNRKGGFREREGGYRSGGGYREGSRDGGGNGGFRGGHHGQRRDQGPKEMHKATCADCNAECEVPFKPSGERPVYCRDCFSKHKKF